MAKPNAQTDLNKQQQQNNNITTKLSINPDLMQNTTKKHYVQQGVSLWTFQYKLETAKSLNWRRTKNTTNAKSVTEFFSTSSKYIPIPCCPPANK